MADFRVRTPAIDPAAFANVLQRKAQMEQEQANIERENKQNRIKGITDAVIAGQNIASNMQTIASNRRKAQEEKDQAEGRQEVMGLISKPIVGSDFDEPSLDPVENKQRMEILKAERSKALTNAFLKANFDKTSEYLLKQKFATNEIKAGDRSVEPLELPDGRVIQTIVDKNTNEVFTLAGDKISKEILDKSQKGFAPQIVEDLEGRKSRVTRGANVSGVFGESKPGEQGKETRIQFTPEERKSIISARTELDNNDFIKKFKGVAPDISLLEELIAKNPKGAIGPVRTQISKQVAGEVGRLTDEDIDRNVPTQDLIPKAKQWLRQIKDGDFTDITRERYGIILDIVQKKRAEEAGRILDDVVNNVEGFEVTGANKEAIRSAIGRGLVPFIDKYKTKKMTPEQEAEEFLKGF